MVVGTPDTSVYTVHYPRYNSKDSPNVLTLTPGFGEGSQARWPPEAEDMTLLNPEHEKHRIWRKTAAEHVARDLGLWNETNQHWILGELPTGYGLFQQITHPKPDSVAAREGSKLRLDRFIFGHSTRKIRSALSLGKHLSFLIFGKHGHCSCDGCKVAPPRPSAAATGAEVGSPAKTGQRKRKRTNEYELAMQGLAGGEVGDDGDEDYDDGGAFTERSSKAASPASGAPPAKKKAAAPLAAAPKPRARSGRARTAKATKARQVKAEWEMEEDDEDVYTEETGEGENGGSNESDFSEYGTRASIGTTRTSSGRRSRPTTKVLSGLQQEAEVAASVDEYAASMDAATAEIYAASSVVPAEQVQQDLTFPSLCRVGELVWVRVPLGPPPQGPLANAQLSRWPGLVRARTIVFANGVIDETYRVELLGMSGLDTLDGVRGENVTPWVGYLPGNTTFLDQNFPEEEPPAKATKAAVAAAHTPAGQVPVKKRWADIQAEGWGGVSNAFRKAQRTGKAYAGIQIRPIPSIKTGPHLARSTAIASTTLHALAPQRHRSRYLSYSHLIYGPELLHPFDWVRLVPDPEVEDGINDSRTPTTDISLPTSLVMRISGFYRGGEGNPLVVKGLIFEQIEIPPADSSPEGLWAPVSPAPDPSLAVLPQALLSTLPAALPFHRWRLLSPSHASTSPTSHESEILLPSIAGRLYPLPPSILNEPKQCVKWLEDADKGMHWWTKEVGKGNKGGYGEEGMKAFKLVMAGARTVKRTVTIEATNGLAGGRDEQLQVAEEQALIRPTALDSSSSTAAAANETKAGPSAGSGASSVAGKGKAGQEDEKDKDKEKEEEKDKEKEKGNTLNAVTIED
ncbi:hypothetical protein JCM11641_006620 [Rhodosporidiobolus odoratus]